MIKGKVVLVPFLFDDLSASKVCPAVCLTDSIGPNRHVIIAFISSRIFQDPLESDIIIDTSIKDFSMTGLRVPSSLRLHRLITVTTSLFQRELGVLPAGIQDEADKRLKKLFNLK